MPKFIDLTGKQFGAWAVTARAPNRGATTMYLCICSCGVEKHVQAGHLTSGASTNCGCIRKPTKHGGAVGEFTKKYKTWRQIKARCCNPNHKNATIYNGLLCAQWLDFAQFDADVPEPPNETATIDRIDNAKGYEPGNIRWVSKAEQHRNQRNCRWIEHNGQRQLLTDWAKELGITISTLHERIEKWGTQKALSR
ncbi:MAG: hypothetical protein MOGMAGMI_02640 [Candidatus Omnitrophica bacterium]|nr:hypothetical protein [Candidatus Omnitrophota bacterium]